MSSQRQQIKINDSPVSVFQALLSSSNALEKQIESSAGSAIFELRESGGLDYKVTLVTCGMFT